MQVSVESVGNLERRVILSLPAGDIDDQVGGRLREIARTVRIKGFRPGKVPAKVVEQRFGGQVRAEILDGLLRKGMDQAVRENELRIAGAPEISQSDEAAEGELKYVAAIELVPDFGELDYGINRAGYVIHGAIHKARHDVACVIHTHTWPGMAVSSLACGLLPMTQTAMRFLRIGYHDYQGVVLDAKEEASLLRDLGDGEALVLRNHGLLTVGKTVGEAFNWMHRLELACRAQLAAQATGEPLVEVPADVLEATWNNYQPKTRRPYGLMEWPALLRKLDRLDPGYRS